MLHQVSLASCALSAEDGGLAAKVSAHGSNRAKLKAGVAVLKGVKMSAEAACCYVLRVTPVSRKIVVKDAAITVKVSTTCH